MADSVPVYPVAKHGEAPRWVKNRYEVGREFRVDPRIHPEQFLYRYMTAEIAYRTLGEQKLWLADPRTWEDPHEEWWCRLLFTEQGHLPGNRAFGTCWTMRWRDEPFWRLQSRTGNEMPAVRIRARARPLAEWFRATVRNHKTKAKGFVGEVSYCPIEQLRDVAGKLARTEPKRVARVGAESLLMKRLAFEFEHEVRLLWIDKARPGSPKGMGFPFDPNQLLDQVMIGPSKKPEAVAEVRAKLIELSISERIITESTIWAPPDVQAAAEREGLTQNAVSAARESSNRELSASFEPLWRGW